MRILSCVAWAVAVGVLCAPLVAQELPDGSGDGNGAGDLPDVVHIEGRGAYNPNQVPGAKQVWEEYGNRIGESESIGALGPDLMGERVNFANGGLSFSVTDVSIAGNHALPVAFTRTFTVSNRHEYLNDAPLADWDIDLPNIHGVFAPDWLVFPNRTDRCSETSHLGTPPNQWGISSGSYWNGNQLHLPGAGGGELLVIGTGVQRPSDGPTYRWMTSDQVFISCLPQLGNAAGEGYRAITPDGTVYLFTWMGTTHEPNLENEWGIPTPRRKRALYATRVEDRFGNWVNYTYTNGSEQPIRLTRIHSSDGRDLRVAYGGHGHVSTVTEFSGAPARSWSYEYGTFEGHRTLSRVTRPDGSEWQLNFGPLSRTEVEYLWPQEHCFFLPFSSVPDRTGTVTHPSGAVGEFRVSLRRFGRSNVPMMCQGPEPKGAPLVDTRTSVWSMEYDSYALVRKSLSGPGIGSLAWNYQYQSDNWFYWPSGTPGIPGCPSREPGNGDCNLPVCTSEGCSGRITTTVSGPANEWVRYQHGNSFHYNEGKLLKVESGSGPSNILSTQTHDYDFSREPSPYPARFGHSLRGTGGNAFTSEYHRPQTGSTIAQQGASFAWTTTGFDAMARPLRTTRASSLGHSRTELRAYRDNPARWVMGQLASLRDEQTGRYFGELTYHAGSDLLASLRRFGKLEQSYAYYPDGTLRTVTDGRGKVYTLSSYHRGIPRHIAMPGGAALSATVNGRGEITSVTDAMGFTTSYQYDPLGRISLVQHPAGDSPAWNATSSSFARHATAAYGLAGPHWRQEISTGQARKVTYFDALWRPVVTREYDNSAPAQTQRFNVRRFDHAGREVFTGYPVATLTNYATLSAGVSHEFDSIGRPTRSRQTSELGLLDTTTAYQNNFRKRVTNPRGQSTWYRFQAFDQPDDSAPVLIQAPENQNTEIVRDVFGKPTSLRRYGDWGGSTQSLTRRYVYDEHELLCKRIEPESGATVFAYDAANNIAWSAEGSPLTGPTCDRASVPSGQRIVRSYDDRNRPLTVAFPGHAQNLAFSYFADGALQSASAGDITSTYQYNRRRLLTAEQRQIAGHNYTVAYEYDANAAAAALVYPDGERIVLAPNALGQPTRVGDLATDVRYDPTGAVTQFSYGNGVTHVAQTNPRQLVSNLSYGRAGTLLLSQDLAYDRNANVTQAQDLLPGGLRTRTMAYDNADRLASATAPQLWGTETFAYDPLDNLRAVQRDGQQRSYHYNADNLLTQVAVGPTPLHTYSYDARGNVSQRDGVLLDFDSANRLRTVGNIAEYAYDAQGRRARRVENGQTRHFVYALDGKLLYEHTPASQAYIRHHYLGSRLIARAEGVAAPPGAAPNVTAPPTNYTGSYTVSWTAVAGAGRYELQERTGGGSWANVYNGPALSRAISGKAAGSYDYRARACNTYGCSGYSAVRTTVVTLPPAAAPTLSAPPTNYTGSYTVSWTAVAVATRYELQERVGAGAWGNIYNGAALSRAISGKAAGSYGYRVRACNVAGCGAYSAIGTTVVTLPPTAAPVITAPAQGAAAGYTVSWTAVAVATRYELWESANGAAWVRIHNGAVQSKAVGPKPAGSYRYRVRGCNVAGCGPYSTIATVIVPPPPPVLPAPQVINLGYACEVVWHSAAGATSYQLRSDGGQIVYDGPNTSAFLPGSCSAHYFVRACGLGGCGSWSGPGSPGPGGPGGPGGPWDPHEDDGNGEGE